MDEDWKLLRSFVGLKFNDKEKRRLWPGVRHLHLKDDLFTKDAIKKTRPDLGTWIKAAIWEKLERDEKKAPRKRS